MEKNEEKRRERENGILSDYGISSAFFPAHLYRQVQQSLHKVSTVRLHGVCAQERLCFPDTWTLEGSTWRERDLPLSLSLSLDVQLVEKSNQ